MLNVNTKSVTHFGKFVPCCEGRVLTYLDHPTRLVRVETQREAETIAKKFQNDLVNNKYLEYYLGDNYMLSQHP